ncbi:MAG: hypothetical protein M1834_007169 [Cirrosporium novae-zelandiae]|nr:MAG: hypothetical protein M1834_007169 [Cirrosporium novae-zelandiae]
MQELTRTSFDQHTEDLENGHPFMDPLIFRIPRDLNSTLNKFYSNYAITYAVEKWLDDNEYHMAIADNATADWMCE